MQLKQCNFSILEATESWAGPGNEATTEVQNNLWFLPGASCLMYLKCFSEASFEGIWLGKVDGEATVNGSMDVLHGKQEAVCTVTH